MSNKYEDFEAKVIRLNRINEKLDPPFDLTRFKKRYEIIKEKFDSVADSKKLIDGSEYDKYINELDSLINEIDTLYIPYYKIYILNETVNSIVNYFDIDGYSNIKDIVVSLIDYLKELCYVDNEEFKKITDSCYETIYKSLIKEELVDKKEVLTYFKNNSKEIMRSKLGTIIRNELVKNLTKEELYNVELSIINKGLGYDYLDSNILKLLGERTTPEVLEKFNENKKTATSEFLNMLDEVKKEKDEFNTKRKEKRKELSSHIKTISLLWLKICSMLSIPVFVVSAWAYAGGEKFKHTTKKINTMTNEKIIDDEITYRPKLYAYCAIIYKYSPWRENGKDGFIRDVEEYMYTTNEADDEITPEEIMNTIKDVKRYTETKSRLSKDDSMTEPEIILEEHIVDDNDRKPNIEAIFILGLLGGIFYLGLDTFMSSLTEGDVSAIKGIKRTIADIEAEKINFKEIYNGKITRKIIHETFEVIGDKIVRLQREYDEKKYIYGKEVVDNQLGPEVVKDAKKLIKIK